MELDSFSECCREKSRYYNDSRETKAFMRWMLWLPIVHRFESHDGNFRSLHQRENTRRRRINDAAQDRGEQRRGAEFAEAGFMLFASLYSAVSPR
jgi:hypothetical protein